MNGMGVLQRLAQIVDMWRETPVVDGCSQIMQILRHLELSVKARKAAHGRFNKVIAGFILCAVIKGWRAH